MGGTPATWEERGLPVGTLASKDHTYTFTGKLPSDMTVQISKIAPAFGQPGGGLQVLVLNSKGESVSVADLIKKGILV